MRGKLCACATPTHGAGLCELTGCWHCITMFCWLGGCICTLGSLFCLIPMDTAMGVTEHQACVLLPCCIMCCWCGGSADINACGGPLYPISFTASISACCCAYIQPLTDIMRQSANSSASSGISHPTHSITLITQLNRQVKPMIQSSHGVFSFPNRVCTRNLFPLIARPGHRQASYMRQFLFGGWPNGPHGHRPPQQTYGSPIISNSFLLCWYDAQQGQQHP